jgi:hypothetical protein
MFLVSILSRGVVTLEFLSFDRVSLLSCAEAPASAPFLTDHAKLIDSVETFIFDCDGALLSSSSLHSVDVFRLFDVSDYFLY